MAVALRSSSSAQAQTGSTFSVTAPSGVTNGDLLVAFQSTFLGFGTAPTAPSGWTLMDRQSFSATGDDLVCWYKVAASEGASHTFNNAGGGSSPVSNVWSLCFSGAGTAPEGITKNSGTGTTLTATGRTTSVDAEMVFCAFSVGANTGETITPNSLTDLGTLVASTNKLDAAYTTQTTAGATGDKTATCSASLSWGTLLVTIPATSAVDYPLNLGPGAFALTGAAMSFVVAGGSGRRRSLAVGGGQNLWFPGGFCG